MRKTMNRVALIIMIKNPVLGKAKTRIAATTGDEEALRIYKLLLDYTRKVAEATSVDRYLYYSDYIEDDAWSSEVFNKRIQARGNLGNRLRDAFSTLSKDYDKMIVIGSDCAGITSNHILTAAAALDNSDMVLGPVHDGGYYLLGMNGYYPEIISDIEWSTNAVTSQTLSKAESINLSTTKIETLHDIDYHEDWLTYGLETEKH